jgi:hypothetical protein
MTVITIEEGRAAIESRFDKEFRANVCARFLDMPRVKALSDISPVEFFQDNDISPYSPYEDDALQALGDDYEIASRWAREDRR